VLCGASHREAALAFAAALCVSVGPAGAAGQDRSGHQVGSLKVQLLSTMLAEEGIGEWGFAALVEADGKRLLFDTGNLPDTVLRNAGALEVDLTGVDEVILSHFHGDHTGGLLQLRRELAARSSGSMGIAHVARGIFWKRRGSEGEVEPLRELRRDYEASGGRFAVHDGPVELHPGVWLTGPVPRIHAERNWSGGLEVETPGGWREDTVPESQSLVIDTDRGLVVVSGCGHAGMVNTLEYARSIVRDAPIHAALGGFHLFRATDEHLEWTASRLRALGLAHLLGAHCTGIEAVYRLREQAGLARATAVVGAVGATFTLGAGIDPLALAR
jgi:7,8-dihydropterin-6-yl-methyl-4-(beta-D-ribofuranosyl)aminobenzene 5'-phosphate synthase